MRREEGRGTGMGMGRERRRSKMSVYTPPPGVAWDCVSENSLYIQLWNIIHRPLRIAFIKLVKSAQLNNMLNIPIE